jgi:iron complex outermembrane receptor protein
MTHCYCHTGSCSRKIRFGNWGFFLLILLLSISLPLRGEEKDPPEKADTEKKKQPEKEQSKPKPKEVVVVVTARRTESRASQTPSNVSIINADEIRSSSAVTVPEFISGLDGVTHYDSSGVGTAGRINLRGFWGGMSTHHLVLVDGIPQNGAQDKLVDWNVIPLENVERIEVVRGPASSLYGENAMAGVINIITKSQSKASETNLHSAYSNFNTFKVGFSVGKAAGNVDYILGFSHKSSDGFREYCNYGDLHFIGKMSVGIGSASDMTISLQHSLTDRGAYPWALEKSLLEDDRDQARPGTEDDEAEGSKTGLGMNYTVEFEKESALETILYIRNEREESFYTRGPDGSFTKELTDNEDILGGIVKYTFKPEFWGKDHSFVIGMDLEQSVFDGKQYDAPFKVRGAIQSDYKAVRDKLGLYAEDEISIDDNCKLLFGVRQDYVSFDFTDRLNSGNSDDAAMSAFNLKLGVVYTYKQGQKRDSSIYGNVSQAFRAPTLGQMFTYGASNSDLKPEKAINYELGIRHHFGGSYTVRLTAYWLDLDNEIWYDSSTTSYENYGKTSHAGIEAGFDAWLADSLKLFATYTYTLTENETDPNKGKELVGIPNHSGMIGADYMTKYGWGCRLTAKFVGTSYLDSGNIGKLAAYSVLDARVQYKSDNMSFFTEITNLLDKEYNSYGYRLSSGTEYFSPVPGRVYSVGINYTF